MCVEQYSSLDMLMYYDARPCGMNGLFCTDFVCDCLKGYYPFRMFNELYKLGNCVCASSDDSDIYVCAACNGDKAAVMLSYFNDDDNSPSKKVHIDLSQFDSTAKIYLLDKEHDMELVNQTATADTIALDIPLFGIYLIVI